jgi:hypothetical protein
MKYSIIMPYWNRETLNYTLSSYAYLYKNRTDYQVIIIEDIKNKTNDLYHRRLTEIVDKYKNRMELHQFTYYEYGYNPAPLYNYGVFLSSGDYMVLTNPECVHLKDILSIYDQRISKNEKPVYMVSACVNAMNMNANTIIVPTYWYEHPVYRIRNIHFCSCIPKKLYNIIGGFDEAYKHGIGFEDVDFINKIKSHGSRIIPGCGLVMHIDHDRSHWADSDKYNKNRTIYNTKWTRSIRRR